MKTTKKFNIGSILKEISSHATIGRLDEAGNFPEKKKPVAPDEEDAQAEVPVGGDKPEAAAPANKQTAPAPEQPNSEPPAPEQDAPAAPADNAPAEPAQEDPNMAKSETDQAEQEIDQPSFVKLNSDTGVKFLLGTILEPAVETNTIDSIAQDFIDKLKINTNEDFQKFKDETIQFRPVSGFNQLLSSMENFIG